MRKITLLLALIFATNFYAQDQKNLAKVQKINGIEVYVLSEPLRDYDVVFGGDNKIQWTSFLTAGLVNESIENKLSKFVKAVQEKSEEDGTEFDAVVYTDGKNVSAIKFTEEKTEENDRMAEVQKMDGIPLFIMSEPALSYTVEVDKGGGIKWKSLVTAGLMNNSIEQDIEKYVKKLDGKFKRGKIDAIMYANGKEADGIKFRG
jgi:ribosomal protein L25 (general stress protein Ctc)